MRQYTENSPGCSTAKYTNVGCMRQYTTQCWKPFLARRTVTDRIGTVTDHIGTVTDHIGTVPGRIGTVTDRIGTATDHIGTVPGRIGTQTTVRLSRKIDLYQSLQLPAHTVFFGFPSQETGTDTFSSRSNAKLKQFVCLFFFLSISPARVAISLVNFRNVFQLIVSGVNTDASTWLLPPDLFRTYSQT